MIYLEQFDACLFHVSLILPWLHLLAITQASFEPNELIYDLKNGLGINLTKKKKI